MDYDYDYSMTYDYNDEEDEYDDTVLLNMSDDFEGIVSSCLKPSIIQITKYIGTLIAWNLICRIAWITIKYLRMGQCIFHTTSFICGFGVLYYVIGEDFLIILLFVIASYIIFSVLEYQKSQRMGFIVAAITITGFLIYELMWDNPSVWHKIRGILMVASMKTISLGFDLDVKRQRFFEVQHSPSKLKTVTFVPELISFLGYLFCPGNCVLGPWISYDSYIQSLSSSKTDFKWIVWTLTNAVFGIGFLTLSNCFVPTLCMDYSWKWLVSYRDALSIRCSHYFVSFLSQATLAASGICVTKESARSLETSPLFGNLVTKPWQIEFPRSLTTVVRSWNIPMHYWLKTYVFCPLKTQGQSSISAIAATYVVSSLLHGLHFQIYAVLLSLGFFTYVEFELRAKIASIFSACICANSCVEKYSSKCQKHEHHWNSIGVTLTNCFFSIVTIIHLAYLGIMLDVSGANTTNTSREHRFSIEIGLRKWMELDYLSHFIFVLSYLFYLII